MRKLSSSKAPCLDLSGWMRHKNGASTPKKAPKIDPGGYRFTVTPGLKIRGIGLHNAYRLGVISWA
ncbi:hypothetical protein AGMMS49991_09850 [Spirochaetia bacterium]|nr:hypothetical protein AGMMS49991_09850 [Spirochaetia bacterium]